VTAPTFRQTVVFFLAGAVAVILAAIFVFGGFLPPFEITAFDDEAFGPVQLEVRPVPFSELPGWEAHDFEPAFSAFLISCSRIEQLDDKAPVNPLENLGASFSGASFGGAAAEWRPVCAAARAIETAADDEAGERNALIRRFFEAEFLPVQILNRRDPLPDGPAAAAPSRIDELGTFTGYFEPAYRASREETPYFSAPVYTRPDDLIEVDLGAFREDLAGERIAGRVDGARLVPYADHREINDGALDAAAEPIAWLAPNDLFFLQIQGSGQLLFEDGEQLRVGYAGQNGHPYTAIGRVMVRDGIMPLEDVSMQSIRQWLDTSSAEDAQAMREENASYVFFRSINDVPQGQGPLGAQGVPLTAGRSLAVDRRFHALGSPVWVDIEPAEGNGDEPIQRLMIAQDTGGAIRGPVRGDVFWGAGAQAEEIAGKMNAKGRMYVLTPRAIAARFSRYAAQ